MKIIGCWLTDCMTEDGAANFQETYDMTWSEMVVKYRLFHVTHLRAGETDHIVFMEHDGSFNGIYTLEPGDYCLVYSEGRGDHGRIFNTDGLAFFRSFKSTKSEGIPLGIYAIESSPYDLELDDEFYDNNELTHATLLANLNLVLTEHDVNIPATNSNTKFVMQL